MIKKKKVGFPQSQRKFRLYENKMNDADEEL